MLVFTQDVGTTVNVQAQPTQCAMASTTVVLTQGEPDYLASISLLKGVMAAARSPTLKVVLR